MFDDTKIFKLYFLDKYPINYLKSKATLNETEVVFEIYLLDDEICCRNCKNNKFTIHDYVTKTILHPVCIGERKCTIKLHLKRYKCKTCGKIIVQHNPISNSSVSYDGIKFIISKIKNTKKTFTELSSECFLAKSTLVAIFDACVIPKPISLPMYLSFDETCVGNFSYQSKYIFVMHDPINSKIIDIYKTRLKDILNQNFSKINKIERGKVKYISMDGWEPYRVIVKRYFPNAIIAVDSFHVLEAISRALDKARLVEAKKQKLLRTEVGQSNYRFLKDNAVVFGYDWSEKNWSSYYQKKTKCKTLQDFFEKVKSISIDLFEAYKTKEKYRVFNSVADVKVAQEIIDVFIKEFKSIKYEFFDDVVNFLINWRQEIINSFIRFGSQRLSTSKIESGNNRIELLNSNGQGYSNFDRFRKRILLWYDLVEIDVKRYNKKS